MVLTRILSHPRSNGTTLIHVFKECMQKIFLILNCTPLLITTAVHKKSTVSLVILYSEISIIFVFIFWYFRDNMIIQWVILKQQHCYRHSKYAILGMSRLLLIIIPYEWHSNILKL